MKRQRIDLADIASAENLLLATWKAAKGKHQRAEIRTFCEDLEGNLQNLRMAILEEKAPLANYKHFYIHDPKKRLIHAASFPDRVLHHAILNLAESTFEQGLINHTYACRPDKGSHKAVDQVQHNIRRYPWFVKVDVDGYFPAIHHQTLKKLLATRFKGKSFLALLNRIIDSYHIQTGFGLPIGSLTSQHFANFYLNDADRWLQNHREVKAMVRYMDDTIWWCETKQHAKSVLRAYQDMLFETRKLVLKPTLQINQSKHGVSYCGYRILKGSKRLTLRKQRRYKQLHQFWERQWLAGDIGSLKLQQAHDAVIAPSLFCDSLTWRKYCLKSLPSYYE